MLPKYFVPCDEHFQDPLSWQQSNKQYITNQSHHAVHYISVTYLFYNRKFVPFHCFTFMHFAHSHSLICICEIRFFFKFKIPHVSEIIEYLSLSDSFHWAQCPQGSPKLVHTVRFHSFSLYPSATYSSSTHVFIHIKEQLGCYFHVLAIIISAAKSMQWGGEYIISN